MIDDTHTVTAPVITDTEVAAAINRMHDGIVAAARTSIETAIKLGGMLTEVRDRQRFGNWLPWCKAHLKFSDRTARNYIAVYERRESLKLETVSNLKDVYRLIATRGTPKTTSSGNSVTTQTAGERDVQPDNEEARWAAWRVSAEQKIRALIHAAGAPRHELAFAHCLKLVASDICAEIEQKERAS